MTPRWGTRGACLVVVLISALWSAESRADPYVYHVIGVTNTAPGSFPLVTFSVTSTATGLPANLQTDPAWTQAGVSRLMLHAGWDTRDFHNRDSGTNAPCLSSPPLPGCARGAALPIPVNALNFRTSPKVVANVDGTYSVQLPLPIPFSATGTGEVIMEGHPAGQDAQGVTVPVPVKSAYAYFPITGPLQARREITDASKCLACHRTDGTGVAPRLTLHGENRTEELHVCVVCHNPNQTDVQRRLATDGTTYPVRLGSQTYTEQSVDFKRLIHGIHASSAGFRKNPLVVIGFNHTVFDASLLTEFPASLRNCLNCHNDNGSKGTFELPLLPTVLGSTFNTRSVLGGAIDADPANDERVTPTAAVCSSCHDKSEAISHMISTGGASFRTTQAAIDAGLVRERCVRCHGPGQDKDVRRVHLKDDDAHDD